MEVDSFPLLEKYQEDQIFQYKAGILLLQKHVEKPFSANSYIYISIDWHQRITTGCKD
jgi:hypothetical protein